MELCSFLKTLRFVSTLHSHTNADAVTVRHKMCLCLPLRITQRRQLHTVWVLTRQKHSELVVLRRIGRRVNARVTFLAAQPQVGRRRLPETTLVSALLLRSAALIVGFGRL